MLKQRVDFNHNFFLNKTVTIIPSSLKQRTLNTLELQTNLSC